MPTRPPSLAVLAGDLAAGKTTSAALVGESLDRIADPAGEGARAFTRVYHEAAWAAADASDRLRAAGIAPGPLSGMPISVKDLFDVAGEPTRAGSRVLADAPPAASDAPVVARLRAAGAVIVGKTNMTEFAFSGLGLNPHYGTPANPWDRTRIPGGSSSGAGVAGPYGFAAASIGTDTGGSVRIPAAFCGVTGFKPTARRVPREGATPLSTTLDSIGPLAATVACCALLDAVLAGETPMALPDLPLAGLRLAVPKGVLTESVAPDVAQAFERVIVRLSAAGARIVEHRFTAMALADEVAALGGVVTPEALAFHLPLLKRGRDLYDPRVLSRLEAVLKLPAVDFITALSIRQRALAAFDAETAGFDALICPTVALPPPRFDDLVDDAAYGRINALVLRNTNVFNLLDRCALSLPCDSLGALPFGLMVVGETAGDRRLLAVGQAIEAALA